MPLLWDRAGKATEAVPLAHSLVRLHWLKIRCDQQGSSWFYSSESSTMKSTVGAFQSSISTLVANTG
jgi:hypothetical protein